MTEATTPTRPAHTPGPWFTRELDFIPLVRGGNPEFLIADAACGRNPRDEDRANARLIAAAPAKSCLPAQTPCPTTWTAGPAPSKIFLINQ